MRHDHYFTPVKSASVPYSSGRFLQLIGKIPKNGGNLTKKISIFSQISFLLKNPGGLRQFILICESAPDLPLLFIDGFYQMSLQ